MFVQTFKQLHNRAAKEQEVGMCLKGVPTLFLAEANPAFHLE